MGSGLSVSGIGCVYIYCVWGRAKQRKSYIFLPLRRKTTCSRKARRQTAGRTSECPRETGMRETEGQCWACSLLGAALRQGGDVEKPGSIQHNTGE